MIDKEILEEFVEQGLYQREIGSFLSLSRKQVAYLLNKYSLRTKVSQDRIDGTNSQLNICGYCREETSNLKFCSRSCSAIYNNKIYKKKKPTKCRSCTRDIESRGNTYCNRCISNNEHVRKMPPLSEAKTDRTRRKILVEELGHKCQNCRRRTWNRELIPLELEHISGNSDNNSRENLTILCPNCHAQTPTYKGKNIGNGQDTRRKNRYKKRTIR